MKIHYKILEFYFKQYPPKIKNFDRLRVGKRYVDKFGFIWEVLHTIKHGNYVKNLDSNLHTNFTRRGNWGGIKLIREI